VGASYRFTGKEEDVEVGLVYFGKRFYSPSIGRWMSADPAAVHALVADPNLYAYVSGRALHSVDAVGLEGSTAQDDVSGRVAAAAAALAARGQALADASGPPSDGSGVLEGGGINVGNAGSMVPAGSIGTPIRSTSTAAPVDTPLEFPELGPAPRGPVTTGPEIGKVDINPGPGRVYTPTAREPGGDLVEEYGPEIGEPLPETPIGPGPLRIVGRIAGPVSVIVSFGSTFADDCGGCTTGGVVFGGTEQHHIFPEKYVPEWEQIKPHEIPHDEFTIRIPVFIHRRITPAWDDDWHDFLYDPKRDGKLPTEHEIYQKGWEMIYEYGLEKYLPLKRYKPFFLRK
jgi:RHS repeat-associated protein